MKQEINSQLKEQTIAYKDKMEKYEKNLKNLINENEKMKEQIVDLETTIEGLEVTLNTEKIKNNENIEKINKEKEELEEELNNIKGKKLRNKFSRKLSQKY